MDPFEDYCNTHRIIHDKVPLIVPLMNTLSKRMNKTIAEKGKSVISHSNS